MVLEDTGARLSCLSLLGNINQYMPTLMVSESMLNKTKIKVAMETHDWWETDAMC